MTSQYHPMQTTDLKIVSEIERRVQYHPWTHQQFQDSLEAGQRCSVWREQDRVVGFCILQPVLDEANLLLMAVDPDYQGRGIGTRLLSAALDDLGEGCVMVFLEVRASNQPALALYEKLGFNRMGIRKNYYPSASGKEDAVLMALTRGNPFA